MSCRALLGAATVACALFGGHVAAAGREVTVAIHVSTQGLDLSQPAGAQKFYVRLKQAARVACTQQMLTRDEVHRLLLSRPPGRTWRLLLTFAAPC